ncbi:MAG: DUF3341 domain-containing protein [Balneolaceae bacterium]|nr:DUF3341 domain-containing protein [Balneolaceae bacterium]
MANDTNNIFAVLAEFRNPRELIDAAEAVEKSGYKKFDTYAPFPIHGMEKAMNLKKSKLGWIVLGGAIVGFFGAVALITWVMGVEYPMNISGKPYINPPIYVPITFELTVLFSAFAATFGMIAVNKLPKLYNPIFNSERFKKASDDSFFITIEAADDLFDEEKAKQLFNKQGATHIETIHE